MKKRIRKVLFWVLAILLTVTIAVYQRLTGPTHPESYKFNHQGNSYKISLPRSQNGIRDVMIRLPVEDPELQARVFYKRFKTGDEMDTIQLHREDTELLGWLPSQPVAGKLEYGLILQKNNGEIVFETPENIVIRFKDEVPSLVLIPHVLLIFTAMLLSNLTGIYAITNQSNYKIYTFLTLLFFLLGGMIMGPIVQKYAFGEFWTGFPLGKDLTDNKALVAFIFWIAAWAGNIKKERKYLVITAAIVNLGISLIPHSLLGSELDYTTGEIKTGMILIGLW